MSQRALLVVAVVLLATILGYLIYRDRVAEAAAAQAAQQEEAEARQLHAESLKRELRGLRLRAFERKFGTAERLRLEAYIYSVAADGPEKACAALSAERCDSLRKNYGALVSDSDVEFVKPPK